MYIQPHDVEHEFPEYRQTLQEMRSQDTHLAKLVAEYEQLNAEIVDIEENDKPFQDFEFEEMKKRRLLLKDEIYLILRGAEHWRFLAGIGSRRRRASAGARFALGRRHVHAPAGVYPFSAPCPTQQTRP